MEDFEIQYKCGTKIDYSKELVKDANVLMKVPCPIHGVRCKSISSTSKAKKEVRP